MRFGMWPTSTSVGPSIGPKGCKAFRAAACVLPVPIPGTPCDHATGGPARSSGLGRSRLTFQDNLEVVEILMTAYKIAQEGSTLNFPPPGLKA